MNTESKRKRNKGFTLMELLVVIAIIGVLSSVVIASLNRSRDKARDAFIIESLQNIRVQSALYWEDFRTYGTTNSVGNDCDDVGTMFGQQDITAIIDSAIVEIPGGAGGMECDATDQTWAVSTRLNLNQAWCTDSTGTAGLRATLLGVNTNCSY